MALHITFRHAEWIDAHLNTRLAIAQRGFHIVINLIHIGIGHGIAANRHAVAVDHQIFPLITLLTIVLIRETDVNCPVEAAIWLQLGEPHAVETFRAFEITLHAFWPKAAGEITDAITVEQAIFVADLAVKLKRALFFENLQIHGGAE